MSKQVRRGLPAVDEQLELLFEAPSAVPGRPATELAAAAERTESDGIGKERHTGAREPALRGRQTAPAGQTGIPTTPRDPPGELVPPRAPSQLR